MVVSKPTLLIAGEAGQREIVAPEPLMRKITREEIARALQAFRVNVIVKEPGPRTSVEVVKEALRSFSHSDLIELHDVLTELEKLERVR
jgi:translation elongation factor EF-1beta